MGMGAIDIALWDFAGKYRNAPIHELLGSYRDTFPAYASTYQGDRNGGLDSPDAYADFAEDCLEMGYQGSRSMTGAATGRTPRRRRPSFARSAAALATRWTSCSIRPATRLRLPTR